MCILQKTGTMSAEIPETVGIKYEPSTSPDDSAEETGGLLLTAISEETPSLPRLKANKSTKNSRATRKKANTSNNSAAEEAESSGPRKKRANAGW